VVVVSGWWCPEPSPSPPLTFSDSISRCAMASQYASEEEVLFPPCTMLQVMPAESAKDLKSLVQRLNLSVSLDALGESRSPASPKGRYRIYEEKEGTKRFLRVVVQPSFL